MTNIIQNKIRTIRLLALDVDGVLTDGGIYMDEQGHELRRFHAHDGYGLRCVMDAGVAVAIISMAVTESVRHRAEMLGISECHIKVANKLAALTEICQRKEIPLNQVAYMGDDVPDIQVLQAVGFPIAPVNAIVEVKENVMYITHCKGGEGAVREVCDLIVSARENL